MVSSVLVIDSDVALSEILKVILEPKAFEVFTAQKVEDGIDAVRHSNPDVIVLDLDMPEKDGWHICKDIRELSNTPILVLSALNDPDAVAHALDEGADDYLIKPVSSGVLVAHLNNLLRRARAEQVALDTRQNSLGASLELD